MPEGRSSSRYINTQREEREKLLAGKPKKAWVGDSEPLFHEFQMHQIELEKQNEELRKAQLELEESREKYIDLYDHAPVGYLTLNEEGLVTDLNLPAARLLGIDRKSLKNKPLSFLIHKKSQDVFDFHRREVLKSATKQVCDLVMKKKDGTLFNAQLESIPAGSDGYRIIRAALTDITERKRTEEYLRKVRDELELRVQERTAELERQAELLDLAHDAIIVRDEHGNITFWNTGAEITYGWTKNEAIGNTVSSLLKTQYPISPQEIIDTVHREGRWEGELIHAGRDGRQIVVLSRWTLRHGGAGIHDELLEINRDITDGKLAEAQLRQSQKMEAIGTLAAGIAHDFNNILAAIIGFTEMALDDIPLDSPVHSNLEFVLKSGIRGRDLVKQILAFSRKTKYKREPLSLSSLVVETLKLLRPSLPTTIEITTNVSVTSDTVVASASELQQIMMNLCTNAAHAMRETGGELNISLVETDIGPDSTIVSEIPPGQYVELTVKDTGTGIDAEVIPRIFEPFFTTKEVGQGTGMGLAVVYGIVKSLNGDIIVKSTPGIGSTFRVLLPKVSEGATPRDLTQETLVGKERILFVDDEELLTEWGKGMLEKIGYKVTAMTDSIEALLTFSKQPSGFDLVITDQTMPEITGINLAEELLNIRPDIPIILCTGHSDGVNSERAKAAGIREFLMKPMANRVLAAAVRRVLDVKSEA